MIRRRQADSVRRAAAAFEKKLKNFFQVLTPALTV
jgi:hypothetical protein